MGVLSLKNLVLVGSNRPWGKNLDWSRNFLDSVSVLEFSSPQELRVLLEASDQPVWIFFTFWSHYVPKEIYSKNRAVIFHMTDLPFGRGGSPLQNLILGGHKSTKLSAIACVEKMDSGDVYLKTDLDLSGTAEEIYLRASTKIPEMIEEIVLDTPIPQKQEGAAVEFRRRRPEESELPQSIQLGAIHDFIRMLDADGYPRAFITFGDKKITFQNASLVDGRLRAQVEIELIRGQE
jgi:methionyl-tRNA formyltransferase